MHPVEFLNGRNLTSRGNDLLIGGIPAINLAKQFGTPLYVINETTIKERYEALVNAFKPHYDKVRIYYAAKANDNVQVLKIMRDLGLYLDTVSPGEIYIAMEGAGFTSDRILYTGNNYSNDDLSFAIQQGVTINLDAPSQVSRLVRILDASDFPGAFPLISFRVNPEFGGGHHEHCITAGPEVKFGIPDEDLADVYQAAIDAGFSKFGIHMHVGSGILDTEVFEVAATKFLAIIEQIAPKLDLTFEFIDFGGGIGIPYKPTDSPIDLDAFARILSTKLSETSKKLGWELPLLCIEPGRFLVAESCVLLSTVTTVKPLRTVNWIGIDAGFNVLARPTLYGSYHHVLVANKMDQPASKEYQIGGPLCESGDVLARDRSLPELAEEDLIAILDSGAYGSTMSSHYNARLLPAEVLIRDGTPLLIRSRESLEDLLSHQVLED